MADLDATDERLTLPRGDCDPSAETTTEKKKFVEPQISVPVDVLEATTFFQVAASGGTNP